MGIPSYFSFIVKNHGNIVRKINRLNKNVDNFYLDSNSIVYDCLRALEKEYNGNDEQFEKLLIEAVCNKIDEYIKIIKPKVIATLGNYSTKFILGGFNVERMKKIPGISNLRGKPKKVSFKDFSDDALLVALSSTNYSPDRSDYLEDYKAYRNMLEEKGLAR